jgi:hypothetical protein
MTNQSQGGPDNDLLLEIAGDFRGAKGLYRAYASAEIVASACEELVACRKDIEEYKRLISEQEYIMSLLRGSEDMLLSQIQDLRACGVKGQ